MEHLYARNLYGRDAARSARETGSILGGAKQSQLDFPAETIPGRGARIEDRLILRIERRVASRRLWFEALRKHARLPLPPLGIGGGGPRGRRTARSRN